MSGLPQLAEATVTPEIGFLRGSIERMSTDVPAGGVDATAIGPSEVRDAGPVHATPTAVITAMSDR